MADWRIYPPPYRRLTLARRLLRRRLLGGGRLLRGGGAVAVVLAGAHALEAGLQRGHEVGHRLLGLLGGWLHGDVLALRLALDELENLLAVRVAVLLRVERARQRVDELLGDLELARVDLDVRDRLQLLERRGVDDLVREDHRRHAEEVVAHWPHGDELLLGADDDRRDRHAAGLAHRVEQQLVGLRAAGPRGEVVRVVVVDRVDLVQRDEVLDLDRLGLLRVQRLELARLDDDIAVGRQLEALDDVLVGHLVAGGRIDALLLDAHACLAVELMEADGLARHRGIELHGHGDEPEGDCTAPDRPWHHYRLCRVRDLPSYRTRRCRSAVGLRTTSHDLGRVRRLDRDVTVRIGLRDARRRGLDRRDRIGLHRRAGRLG